MPRWPEGYTNKRTCPQCGGAKSFYSKTCKKCQPFGWREKSPYGYILVPDPSGARRPGPIKRDGTRYMYRRRRFEHSLVVEKALGHPLPRGAQIHHVDGDRANNHPSNLVACQDGTYHTILELRTRALRECGNPNYRRCDRCGLYDAPANLLSYRVRTGKRKAMRHRRRNHLCLTGVPA